MKCIIIIIIIRTVNTVILASASATQREQTNGDGFCAKLSVRCETVERLADRVESKMRIEINSLGRHVDSRCNKMKQSNE